MTNEDIEALIDQLNSGIGEKKILLSPISDIVEAAKVWTEDPRGEFSSEGSYDFYFVKNIDKIYVAAVFDMIHDLHVFVKQEHRGKGYLSLAMQQTILPYLFQNGRKEQSVSFKDLQTGRYVNKCWGFEIIGDRTARKSLTEYEGASQIMTRKRIITKKEYEAIAKNIALSRLYITMAAEQLESALGKGNDGGLHELAREISYQDDDILDFIELHQDSPYGSLAVE